MDCYKILPKRNISYKNAPSSRALYSLEYLLEGFPFSLCVAAPSFLGLATIGGLVKTDTSAGATVDAVSLFTSDRTFPVPEGE